MARMKKQNRERVNRITNAIATGDYIENYDGGKIDLDNMRTAIIAALADLRHLCDRHRFSFEQCSLMAEIHHAEEA